MPKLGTVSSRSSTGRSVQSQPKPKPKPAKKTNTLSKVTYKGSVTSSKRDPFMRKRLAVHGKPGSGKSVLAATLAPELAGRDMSKKAKSWMQLDSTLWISGDTNATSALLEHKIEVPEIKLWEQLAESDDTIDVINDALDEVYEWVKDNDTRLVVLDTASKIDKPICRWWEENGPTTKSGARDSFAIWRNVVAAHDRIHTDLDRLPCDVVFLMHSKPRSESDLSDRKKRASALPGDMADIKFDFMYEDAANTYRRDTDFVFIQEATPVRNRKGEFTYKCHNSEQNGFEGKSRFRNTIPSENESHLGDIYTKLKKDLGL